MCSTAKHLRERNRKASLLRCELPGDGLSVAEILADLHSRPGASIGPSMTR
jgi:hypothetical protein